MFLMTCFLMLIISLCIEINCQALDCPEIDTDAGHLFEVMCIYERRFSFQVIWARNNLNHIGTLLNHARVQKLRIN